MFEQPNQLHLFLPFSASQLPQVSFDRYAIVDAMSWCPGVEFSRRKIRKVFWH